MSCRGVMFQLALACGRPTTPALRVPHARLYSLSHTRLQPTHAPHAADDDNFVDIDHLIGLTAATQNPALEAGAASPSSRLRDAARSEVLGVVRVVPEEEGTRYSRLRIPLDADETADTRPRANTRASLMPGEEADYADKPADASANAAVEVSSLPNAIQDVEAAMTAHEPAEEGRLPSPSRLPYDDERFAEMLLEMEVNGVIDEAWQDAKKARMEDVKEIADILSSLKVRDLCCIDVSEKTSNFDYMMFGTCEGARHIHLAAWAVQDADKVHRISKIKRKQTDELWEVVPVGRIVVNLMVESFREEMTLERKWAVTRSMDPLAAANAPISEGRQVKAHGLWTLTLNLQDLEDFEVDYCKDILMRQM
ncbi:Oligomerization domain family protein [Leishmania donovani]|uniref:Oligomerization domain family protein n=1 Tax=Leishmania donovani TaxID=5661 RepID=A0A504XAW5_LEIDO|nr:Oligomerization domain family protein [Leishmania donovani]